jgi:hypothetical protein
VERWLANVPDVAMPKPQDRTPGPPKATVQRPGDDDDFMAGLFGSQDPTQGGGGGDYCTFEGCFAAAPQ